jgi:hypothetical protein
MLVVEHWFSTRLPLLTVTVTTKAGHSVRLSFEQPVVRWKASCPCLLTVDQQINAYIFFLKTANLKEEGKKN